LPSEPGPNLSSLPKRFGRYEVVRELGKGAMGVVYLGRDPVIGRLVALKTIRVAAEDDLEQREFNERFLREAQAAGTLSHPNIVTVHDVGEEDEISFIAMEYVEGKNLKQIIREKVPLSWERIAEIMAQVAEGLDYAHRKGIVHRDVKPANIIITPDGTVKITDFGIAKIETSSLTETGQFLGTPNYMSPEQVTGEAVDGRSDLFSLGVVLYELLTRKKPFLGDNVTSISYKIVHEDFPALQTVDGAIPTELSPILARALAKDPAARFQRGVEFMLALAEFRARHAEYQMIRNLGEMVAQAERLGPVATVEASPAAKPPRRPTGPEATARLSAVPPAAVPDVTAPLEALARRRDDLNPQLVGAPPAGGVDSSGPDWSLDTDAVMRRPQRESAPAEPAAREIVPSSPGTLISDLPKTRKPAGGETLRASNGSISTLPVAPTPPVIPALKIDEKARLSERPNQEPIPPQRTVPAVDISTLPKPEAATGARRPPLVTPPALPGGAGPGPRPPALPLEATGPIRRAAAAPPGPPLSAGLPRPSVPSPTAGAAPRGAPGPHERTAPLKLEAPAPPPAKERTSPFRTEPFLGAPQAPVEAAERNDRLEFVLRRDLNRRWAFTIVAALSVVAIVVVVVLFTRSRQIVPRGEGDRAAAHAAVAEKRHLLDDGNRLLGEGKIQEAKERFVELSRLAPESAAAREALGRTERLLVKKAERDRRNAEVARHLSAARTARDGRDPAGLLAATEAALALEPDHPEALALKSEALDQKMRLPRAEKRKVEARLKSLRAAAATASPSSPTGASATAGPEAAVVGPPLRVTFRSPFPAGTVFVGMNGSQVLRRTFDFGGRSGGTVEASVELPAATGEIRAWVFSADGKVREYGIVRADLGAPGRSLVLGLDSRKLSLKLE
jgi:predicted Ser/Thr protein kinase